MPGISFDRAAEFYDATRGYAEGYADGVRDAIVALTGATKATRFLEIGVGTGRIALPFIRAGYDYTGVDLSQAMMDRLRQKLADDPAGGGYRYTLRQGDVTQLPFDDGSFDVVIAVHVLHLVSDRSLAQREVRRVLKRPGGWFLNGHDRQADEPAPVACSPVQVRQQWLAIVKELQGEQTAENVDRWVPDEAIAAELQALGANTQIVDLAPYERPPVSPRAMADAVKARIFSSDWQTSDEVHAEASRRLDRWLQDACPDPDTPVRIGGMFRAVVARFGS